MGRYKELKGLKFNNLTVIEFLRINKHYKSVWLCECDCGNKVEVWGSSLTTGHTKSCGCYKIEVNSRKVHGKSNQPIYHSWQAMMQRCNHKSQKSYADYGARGIAVCEKWQTFKGFYDDMGDTYVDGLTIDRVDVNGGYFKENCVWSTRSTQNNNKRNNIIVTYKGCTDTLANICRKHDLNYRKTLKRIRQFKWPIEKALSTS